MNIYKQFKVFISTVLEIGFVVHSFFLFTLFSFIFFISQKKREKKSLSSPMQWYSETIQIDRLLSSVIYNIFLHANRSKRKDKKYFKTQELQKIKEFKFP